jgi:hypothetical protein
MSGHVAVEPRRPWSPPGEGDDLTGSRLGFLKQGEPAQAGVAAG